MVFVAVLRVVLGTRGLSSDRGEVGGGMYRAMCLISPDVACGKDRELSRMAPTEALESDKPGCVLALHVNLGQATAPPEP